MQSEIEKSVLHDRRVEKFLWNNNKKHDPSLPVVFIIIAYYNGQQYFCEQLNSIINQTYKNFHIIISDDNSIEEGNFLPTLLNNCDAKVTLLRRFENIGYARNFAEAFNEIPDDCTYVAFCDQDDIWLPNKIERAVEVLEAVPNDKPALYCSRTELVATDGRTHIGHSPLFKRNPSFENALMQNIAGGNTMVLNRKAAGLFKLSTKGRTLVTHDWWAYLIVSGAGGNIHYDAIPTLKYRQHEKNAIGSNNGWTARLKRAHQLLRGHFRCWCNLNVSNLYGNIDQLTPKNRQVLEIFERSRNSWLIPRIYGLWKSQVHRQTLLGNFGLIIAALLKKV